MSREGPGVGRGPGRLPGATGVPRPDSRRETQETRKCPRESVGSCRSLSPVLIKQFFVHHRHFAPKAVAPKSRTGGESVTSPSCLRTADTHTPHTHSTPTHHTHHTHTTSTHATHTTPTPHTRHTQPTPTIQTHNPHTIHTSHRCHTHNLHTTYTPHT